MLLRQPQWPLPAGISVGAQSLGPPTPTLVVFSGWGVEGDVPAQAGVNGEIVGS